MSVLTKRIFRIVLRNRGQTIAVALVVMCGTASYIALASAYRNLELTRDTYYSAYNFADFEVMLERAPQTTLFKLEAIPGVRKVRGRIVKEVNLDIEGVDEARLGRLISMPNHEEGVLNGVVVRSGRYFSPGATDEVILSERFAEANELDVGASLRVTIDGRKHTLRIVGLGLSPEYVYVIRNVQELVPSPERFGILWVSEDFAETALSMQAAYNNVIGTVDDPEDLERILNRAEDLLEPYGVFAKVKRENQLSNRFVSDEIRGLEVSARIVPSIFLGVSALVILILLNRMVRNERTQIGLLKAYGYSDWRVSAMYLQFALILSASGCVAAFFVGQWLANGMIELYVQFYQFPLLRSRLYPGVLATAMGIALAFSMVGAFLAAWRAGKIQPADAIRPEAPAIGHRTWLESMPMVWARLGFTWKMIARNVSRSKFRTGLNAFGVMISSGLLIVGFYSLDAMNYLIDYQYTETRRDDVKVSFVREFGKEALYEAQRFDHVRRAEPVLQYPFEIRNEWRKKDVVIFGLERNSKLQRLLDADRQEVDIGTSGLVLAERLAQDLGVSVGDTLILKPLMGRITKEWEIPVSKVVKEYFGAAGYMNIHALSRVLDEGFAMNAVLLRTELGMENALNEALKDVPAVAAVEIKEVSRRTLQETIAESMAIMSTMIVFFAGVIACSIVYNVTTVSLAERQRELASLRVLGFSKQEIGRILYNENLGTGAIGLLLGTPFGALMCWWMVRAYDTDLFRFPFYIAPRTLLIANVLTILFIVIANVAVRHKIHRLDMVEVLKARE